MSEVVKKTLECRDRNGYVRKLELGQRDTVSDQNESVSSQRTRPMQDLEGMSFHLLPVATRVPCGWAWAECPRSLGFFQPVPKRILLGLQLIYIVWEALF